MTQCRAKAKRTGERCQAAAMPNGVCRVHGGQSRAGLNHPSLTHGRYSKHLPTKAMVEFQQALHDPELLSLRNDIALVDVRLNELVGGLSGDTLPDTPTWREILSVLQDRVVLVNSERKRLVDMQQMITGDQAMLLVARLAEMVNRHVSDPMERAAIATELGRITVRKPEQGDTDSTG